MRFKVSARTILQLGAELISSDAVAFYELIKNAFDAGSPSVAIRLLIRIPFEEYLECDAAVRKHLSHKHPRTSDEEGFALVKDKASKDVDRQAPEAGALIALVERANSWEELGAVLDEANSITIEDAGGGMSRDDLEEIYLTIGTRFRLEQKRAGIVTTGGRPVLGEKGIGRLSVMRLGSLLRLETTVAGDTHWNVLEIDWRRFSHASNELVGDIEVSVSPGRVKSDVQVSGTTIWIGALASKWDFEKLNTVTRNEFSKFSDPFAPESQFPIELFYNDRLIKIPKLEDLIFKYAHALMSARYEVDPEPVLRGEVNYRGRNRITTFDVPLSELLGISATNVETLKSLGPFEVVTYWYNRQLLRNQLESTGEKKTVLEIQKNWSGGLKLYRDGFRVTPYGDPNDDWLDLDREAFAAKGYKVNRAQLVGKVDIGFNDNPSLMDQTNREGLRDCPEKGALRYLLKYLLEGQLRVFLDRVEQEIEARNPLTFDSIEEKLAENARQFETTLEQLGQSQPAIQGDAAYIVLGNTVKETKSLLTQARDIVEGIEKGRSRLLHLAGLGLMVEVLIHELARVTRQSLTSVGKAIEQTGDRNLRATLRTLQSQLQTLEKRVRVLDPLSDSGRQRKEDFDLYLLAKESLEARAEQLDAMGVEHKVKLLSETGSTGMKVHAVKGMIVQVLENLLENSVYWLGIQKRTDKTFAGSIIVIVDVDKREMRVTDNGPGVRTERQEDIFQAFVSSKPPGEGKGLGLFISREIATYHNATLIMSPEPQIHLGRSNTFVLTLK